MPYNSSANQTPAETSHLLVQLQRLDGAIDKEFTLVSERMTWLVVSESFIFSAFAATVANYKPDHKMATALLFLLWALPFVGFLLAVLVYPAILAAHSAAFKLKNLRDTVDDRIPIDLKVAKISSKTNEHLIGNIPPYAIPPIFIIVWLVLIIVLLVISSRGSFA